MKTLKINLDDIRVIENYRTHKKIWCYTPESAPFLHMGYIDNVFFFYTLPPYNEHIRITHPETIIDYYEKNIFFKDPQSEYNLAFMNGEYRPYLNALNSMKAMHEAGKGFGCE